MRQQCQRVLANPYYQDELKNQIRTLDNQIATEQVIKGKLTYLNQMFKQVINTRAITTPVIIDRLPVEPGGQRGEGVGAAVAAGRLAAGDRGDVGAVRSHVA